MVGLEGDENNESCEIAQEKNVTSRHNTRIHREQNIKYNIHGIVYVNVATNKRDGYHSQFMKNGAHNATFLFLCLHNIFYYPTWFHKRIVLELFLNVTHAAVQSNKQEPPQKCSAIQNIISVRQIILLSP
jgi:hypothetical protein